MSGGSYDYAYSKVLDMVDEMERFEHSGFAPSTPLRIAFRGLLERVGTAMKAVEWVDSGDCSEPHAEDAIRACLYYARDTIQVLAVEETRRRNQEPVLREIGHY